jgi:hypothetical protein
MASCADCKFFLNAQIMGSCRRYPQTINRHMNDWCGEHSLPIKIEPEMVNLPVYDIMTDTISEPKKRGRKPKNDPAIA